MASIVFSNEKVNLTSQNITYDHLRQIDAYCYCFLIAPRLFPLTVTFSPS